MPRYYQYGGRPQMYEADWQGWPLPAIKTAPGSLGDHEGCGSLGDCGRGAALGNYVTVGQAPNGAPGAKRLALLGVAGVAIWWAFFRKKPRRGPKKRRSPKSRRRLSTLRGYMPAAKKKAIAKKGRLRTAAGRRRSAAAKKGWRSR